MRWLNYNRVDISSSKLRNNNLKYKDAALPIVSNAKPCALISVQSQNSGASAHKNGIFKAEAFSAPEKKFVAKSMPASSLYYIISETPIRWRDFITVAILFFINLLNYMDRFTIAGVLTEVQEFYNIGDWEAGLLQTVFISFYMVFAPTFGYFGDRYSRKKIMICGVVVWSGAVLFSSFVPKEHFLVFLLLRGVVGIGEASYQTVAITILGDLFTKQMRSRMLMLFYFAVPIGSGLGFIVGSKVAKAAYNQWQWGVRVTPPLGVICILLAIFVLKEPKRGAAEQNTNSEPTSWLDDLRYLWSNRSYVWSTFGFTCVAFTVGSLSWWTPNFVIYSQRSRGIEPDNSEINLVFGLITCLAGFFGVAVGSTASQIWRRTNPRADPLVCAIGLTLCVPFLYAALCTVEHSLTLCWPLIFATITLLCINWSILSDILLSVIVPYRRSTATACQILVSHLLGDASSPYIIGQLSDILRGTDQSDIVRFVSLKNALFMTTFTTVLGAFFFYGVAWYIEESQKKMNDELNSCLQPVAITSSSSEFPSILNNDLPYNSSEEQLVAESDTFTRAGDKSVEAEI
ncbi:Protein spinster -like protein 1 [Trichinella zimbabwensis]|uniref:Protein spinster-like protein 1 n=1 Tax=Trichinella zimbabwensis TaxID=268475 RepID=A0A0V1H8L1_9BILA|nr:Protein spinster -like protein 1 [Trichinella zimbabwensis]